MRPQEPKPATQQTPGGHSAPQHAPAAQNAAAQNAALPSAADNEVAIEDLVSKENPMQLFTDYKKIGEGYCPLSFLSDR